MRTTFIFCLLPSGSANSPCHHRIPAYSRQEQTTTSRWRTQQWHAGRRAPIESLFLLYPPSTYGSPIFKVVQKKWYPALYRALTKSPISPESAVGEGAERSHVDRSGVAP